jgi:AcrR family transcriptional regulator
MGTETRTARATRMPPAERRAAIVAATLPLVLEHGSAVSTRQIAEAAGVAEGTIFRVFPDKEALMCAVIGEAFDPAPTLRQLTAVDRSLPLRPRLVAITEVLQARTKRVFALIDALELTGPPKRSEPPDPDGPRGPAATDRAILAALHDLLDGDADQLRVPVEEFGHVLRLLMFSSSHPVISGGRPLSAEQIVGVLLDGLSRPTAEPATTEPPRTDERSPAHLEELEV